MSDYSDIDALIHKEMEKHRIPGLGLAVVVGNRPVLLRGYGQANVEHKIPVTPHTRFEIASVTKIFTATAVMLLVDEGMVDLDASIGAYVLDLPAAWQPITVRHILAHQSGLPDYTAVDRYWTETRLDVAPSHILGYVADLPLLFPPGERWSYDNTGYFLLGLLLEAVSGQRFGDLLHQRIFAPLAMNDTLVNDPYAIVSNRAAGYSLVDGELRNKAYYSPSGTFSAGALLSSVADLARWDVALTNGAVLAPRLLADMLTPHPSRSGGERRNHFTMGLGWFLVDERSRTFAGHNGSILGFASSYTRYLADGVSVILLCNQDGVGEPHRISGPVARYFLA